VVAAIGAFDHRAVVAASVVQSMSATERFAVHVAVDADEARSVGLEWMSQPPGMPLHIVDDFGGVATTMAIVAQELLASGDVVELIMVVGQLRHRGVSRNLLHDATAEAIGRAVDGVPGARAIVLPVTATRR